MSSLVVIGQQIKEKRRGGHNVPPSLLSMVPKYPSLNRVKVFPEGRVFVNITLLEGGPTATGINSEDGTAKKSCHPPPPHRLISGTALTKICYIFVSTPDIKNPL